MSVPHMKQSIEVRDAISRMSSYKPPLENRDPEAFLLMDFNESPLPPPPGVIQKISEFLNSHVHIYPKYGDFLEKLGNYSSVPAENLLLTNGSDQAIDIIMRSLLENGEEAAMVHPGFQMYNQTAGTLGCKLNGPQFPGDFHFPHEELKESVNTKTRLIVLINPNNPTGSSISLEQIEDLLKSFPDIPVLVDEAYYEFTGETCVSLLSSYPNLIVIRTFSKALALPSLRLGYVIASPDFILELQKIRGPYDVNVVAVLAAREQLNNPEHWQKMVRHLMDESKPAIEKYFDEKQVRYFSSKANFMLVEPSDVQQACKFLMENKILVRPMRSPIDHKFRMSLRTMPEMQRFMDVFTRYLNS
ncbi:MAG: histidinol-phosphate transaminase [SAR324 cluster bacterium]|nr:histidinol-phosphate transaminase [SAR324 cluster bacterium]